MLRHSIFRIESRVGAYLRWKSWTEQDIQLIQKLTNRRINEWSGVVWKTSVNKLCISWHIVVEILIWMYSFNIYTLHTKFNMNINISKWIHLKRTVSISSKKNFEKISHELLHSLFRWEFIILVHKCNRSRVKELGEFKCENRVRLSLKKITWPAKLPWIAIQCYSSLACLYNTFGGLFNRNN